MQERHSSGQARTAAPVAAPQPGRTRSAPPRPTFFLVRHACRSASHVARRASQVARPVAPLAVATANRAALTVWTIHHNKMRSTNTRMRSNIEVKRCDATFYSMFHLSEWNVANTFVDCLTSCAAPRASHGSEASACCQVHPAIGCDGGSRRERRSAHHGGKAIKARHSDAAIARTKCVLDTRIHRGRQRWRHQSVHFACVEHTLCARADRYGAP